MYSRQRGQETRPAQLKAERRWQKKNKAKAYRTSRKSVCKRYILHDAKRDEVPTIESWLKTRFQQ